MTIIEKKQVFFITFCLSKSGARTRIGEIFKAHLGLFEVTARLQSYSHSTQQHQIRGQGYSNEQKTIYIEVKSKLANSLTKLAPPIFCSGDFTTKNQIFLLMVAFFISKVQLSYR